MRYVIIMLKHRIRRGRLYFGSSSMCPFSSLRLPHRPPDPLPFLLPLPKLPLPLSPPLGPSISLTSFLLNLSVPPFIFPTVGPPTPESLSLSLLLTVFFSSTMPLSLASLRRVSSFVLAFASMPLRCASGIFCLALGRRWRGFGVRS